MNRNVLIAVGALVLAVVADAADAPSTLDGFKAIYEKAQASIDAEHAKQQTDALEGYGKALDECLVRLKQHGKLDDYLVVEKERKRFTSEQTIPKVLENGNEHIALAVAQFNDAIAKSNADVAKKTSLLAGQYIVRLDGLIKDLMKADKIAEAKLVKEEKQRVEFLLADTQSKRTSIPNAVVAVGQTGVRGSPLLGRWTCSVNKGGFSAQLDVKEDGTVRWEGSDGWKGTWYWSPFGTNAFLISFVKGVQGNKGSFIVHLSGMDDVAECDDWYAGVKGVTLRRIAKIDLTGKWHRKFRNWDFLFNSDGTFRVVQSEDNGTWSVNDQTVTMHWATGPANIRVRVFKLDGSTRFHGVTPDVGEEVFTKVEADLPDRQ